MNISVTRLLEEQRKWLGLGLPADAIVGLSVLWLGIDELMDSDGVYRRGRFLEMSQRAGMPSTSYMWRMMEQSGSFECYDGSWKRAGGVFASWPKAQHDARMKREAQAQMQIAFEAELTDEQREALDLVAEGEEGYVASGDTPSVASGDTLKEKLSEGIAVSGRIEANPPYTPLPTDTDDTKDTSIILSCKDKREENKKKEERNESSTTPPLFGLPDPMPTDVCEERLQKVCDYFNQLNNGTSEERYILTTLVQMIKTQLNLDETKAVKVMIEIVNNNLIIHFAKHKGDFVGRKDPGRLSWLNNWLKCQGVASAIRQAQEALQQRATSAQFQAEREAQHAAARQHRPNSPYEWTDPASGLRYYEDPRNHHEVALPFDAPFCPGEHYFWNKIKRSWNEIKA